MNSDAKLETESEDGNGDHVPDNLDPHVYHPTVALKNACQVLLSKFLFCLDIIDQMVYEMKILNCRNGSTNFIAIDHGVVGALSALSSSRKWFCLHFQRRVFLRLRQQLADPSYHL